MDPIKIPLSAVKALPFDFEQAVETYVDALHAHRFTEGEPAPSAPHPLVEHAVRRVQYPTEGVHQPTHTYERELDGKVVQITEPVGEPVRFVSSDRPDDFVPNYEIVDDTPPAPTLEERKTALEAKLHETASAIMEEIWPRRKRNLHSIRINEIAAIKPEHHTPEHKAALANAEDVNRKFVAVQTHLAHQLAAIDDLTEETIDGWEPAPFPT